MNSRKFIRNRQLPNTGDVNEYQDFSQVLSDAKIVKSVISMSSGIWIATAVILVSSAVFIALKFLNPAEENLTTETNSSIPDSAPIMANEKKSIAPPIPELNIPFEKYSFDASIGYELTSESGSVLEIPAEAFEKLSGEIVSGNVDVYYREFHDPVDFFVSGIPMTYDSAGIEYTFESAGMMEIRVLQNGDTLKLAEDKIIEVELATFNDDKPFNVYRFNEVKGNWDYLGVDKLKPREIRNDYISESDGEFLSEPSADDDEVIKPLIPQQADTGKYMLSINYDAQIFPELACYNDIKFQAENDAFRPEFYQVVWEEMKLDKSLEDQYIITLMTNDTSISFPVSPVFERENIKLAKEIFELKYADYQAKMNKINQERDDKNSIENDEKLKRLTRYAKKRSEHSGNALEPNQVSSFVRGSAPFINRGFNIANLGVINCDLPRRKPPGGFEVNAVYVDETGKPLYNVGTVYFVDKRRNSLYTCIPRSVEFNPKHTKVLWCVISHTGKVQLGIARTDYSKLSRFQRDVTFNLLIMDQVDGIDELRRIIMES